MGQITRPAAFALFRSVDMHGHNLLFWIRGDDRWSITQNGTRIATGRSGARSLRSGSAQFLSLAMEQEQELEEVMDLA